MPNFEMEKWENWEISFYRLFPVPIDISGERILFNLEQISLPKNEGIPFPKLKIGYYLEAGEK
jgi:hypothetical protein